MNHQAIINALLWISLVGCWSSAFTVINYAVDGLDPILVVAGRLLVASVVIYGVMHLSGERLSWSRQAWGIYTVTALLGNTVPFLLITYASQNVDSALVALLIGTVPIIVWLGAAILFADERLTWRSGLGVFGGFCGLLAIFGPSALGGLGDAVANQALVMGAALCYALVTLYVKKYGNLPALEIATGSILVATAITVSVALAVGTPITPDTFAPGNVLALIYLGVISTALGNVLYFVLIRRIGANRVAQANFAVPVGATILGVVFLAEAITATQFLALALIVGSVYLGTTGKAATAKDAPAP
ncbi:MAG: DMT family transporter [Pseudomonadota bacterium]